MGTQSSNAVKTGGATPRRSKRIMEGPLCAGFDQIQIRIFLAAPADARRVRPNITDVAPVRDGQLLAILVHEHRPQVDRINFKPGWAGEMSVSLKIDTGQALIVQDTTGRVVTIHFDLASIGGFD